MRNLRSFKEISIYENNTSLELELDNDFINIIGIHSSSINNITGTNIKSINIPSGTPGCICVIYGRNSVIQDLTIKTNFATEYKNSILCPGNIDYVMSKNYFGATLVYNGREWRITGSI